MKKKKFIKVLLLFIIFSVFGVFNKSALAINNNYDNQLTLLKVVKTWGSLEEINWEYHAIVKTAPGYELYEAAIWNDSVRLYKFDSSFDFAKLNKQYRESFLVSSYPIPGGRDSENASKYITAAFKDIFKIMVTKSPAKHYGIKYTGHGSGAGYMFESKIKPNDAQEFLKYATEILGRKIDFYDMSTNCN